MRAMPGCLPLSFLALLVCSCTWSNTECDCTPSGIFISSNGAQAKTMTLSGDACEQARITRGGSTEGFEPNSDFYGIQPAAEGSCTVDIVLQDGRELHRTVTVIYVGGDCCAGYYTEEPYWDLDGLAGR